MDINDLFDGFQFLHFICDFLAGSYQIREEAFINVHVSLVLAQISCIVTLCEHTPDFRSQPKCLRKYLKDYIAVRRPVPMPS